MTLEEAIEKGTKFGNDNNLGLDNDEIDAIKMLIEAGKRVKYNRQHQLFPNFGLLPGETED